MHRVPFWGAVAIEIILIFVAISSGTSEYQVDQGYIWMIIGTNFLFIIIPVIKATIENKNNNEITNKFINEYSRDKLSKDTNPEFCFNMALSILKNDPSQEQIEYAIELLIYAAEKEYEPAKELLEQIKKDLLSLKS